MAATLSSFSKGGAVAVKNQCNVYFCGYVRLRSLQPYTATR